MTERTVWLPLPVTTNNLFGHGLVKGKVRRFPTAKYRRWQKQAHILLLAARIPRFVEPVVVKLAIKPRNRRSDADNYTKAVLDSLVAARVLHDDSSQWVKSVVTWFDETAPEVGVWVTIRVAELALFKAAQAA